jgi:CheY-like chemotaxis protein
MKAGGKFLQQFGHLIRLLGKYGMPVTCNSAFYRLAHPLPELRLYRFNSQAAMKKALIIEDHPDIIVILSRQLGMMGFAIISANNGMEGVEKAIEEKPDLIIMDILMPGMDGREATRMIRTNPKTKDIPIIVLTVLFRHLDQESCIEAGCNDYIVKPFRFKVLQEKIRTLISASSPNIQ